MKKQDFLYLRRTIFAWYKENISAYAGNDVMLSWLFSEAERNSILTNEQKSYLARLAYDLRS